MIDSQTERCPNRSKTRGTLAKRRKTGEGAQGRKKDCYTRERFNSSTGLITKEPFLSRKRNVYESSLSSDDGHVKLMAMAESGIKTTRAVQFELNSPCTGLNIGIYHRHLMRLLIPKTLADLHFECSACIVSLYIQDIEP